MSTTLQDLVNQAVFYSTEMQSHFGRLIAEATWEVDFTADPQLTFTAADESVLRTRPHLVGSASESQGTWLWGWENVNDFPHTVVDLAHEIRKFGAAHDVADLTTVELPLDDELALRLTLAAKVATDKWAHYPAAAGAGTTVWLLVDSPALEMPAPQVKTSVRALMQGLTQTTVDDHRAAVDAYVQKRGIPTVPLAGEDDATSSPTSAESPAEAGLRLLFSDGCADLTFDELKRISNCQVHAPLEGEAAAQYAAATGGQAAQAAETGTAKRNEPTVTAAETAPATEEPTEQTLSSDAERAYSTADARPELDTVGDADAVAAVSESAGTEQTAETAAHLGDVTEDSTSSAPKTVEDEEQPTKKRGLFSRLFGR